MNVREIANRIGIALMSIAVVLLMTTCGVLLWQARLG